MYLLIALYAWVLRGRGPAVAVVVLLVLASHWRRHETPATLGVGWTNFGRCVRAFGPVVAGLALLIAWDALRHGPPPGLTPGRAAAVLVGYCAWGLVQQWALCGYFFNRFAEAFGGVRGGVPLAALAAATCFAGAHLPNWFLVWPTLVLGFFSALGYRRYRNLLFLGAAHGLLGALLVLLVARSLPQGLRTGPGAARHAATAPASRSAAGR